MCWFTPETNPTSGTKSCFIDTPANIGFRNLADVDRPLIIGHRGASALAPENTLASFSRAIADGADGFEFDVRLSRDHIPVVIHDADLKRTAHKNSRVAALSAQELSQIDVGLVQQKAAGSGERRIRG